MRQEVRVAAVTVITEPDGTVTSGTNQGLLVGPGNAGKFGRDRYTFVPEGAVRIGYAFNEYVSLRVGYSFIYLDEVLRPGNQIDRRVNVQPVGAQGLPQPLAPLGPVFGGSHFWAQGLDLGVQVRF
jgi:hypothetical protein